MGKVSFPLALVLAMTLMQFPNSEAETHHWRSMLGLDPEKVTNIHFYFHDTVSGRNPSAIEVARAPITAKSPTEFGLLVMMDDPLTEGPEPTSKVIGRAQGIYGSEGQTEFALLMTLTYTFTDGDFSGSSLSVLGRNPVFQTVREMPVVGGTGQFRFARGYALAKTHWLNANTGDAIVEYNVTVVH